MYLEQQYDYENDPEMKRRAEENDRTWWYDLDKSVEEAFGDDI